MLSCAVMFRRKLSTKRRAMVSKQLNFLDQPLPETYIWEQLSPQRQMIITAALARLIARAALADITQERTDDRHNQDQTNSHPESSRRLCAPVHHLSSGAASRVDRTSVRAGRKSQSTWLDQRAGDP